MAYVPYMKISCLASFLLWVNKKNFLFRFLLLPAYKLFPYLGIPHVNWKAAVKEDHKRPIRLNENDGHLAGNPWFATTNGACLEFQSLSCYGHKSRYHMIRFDLMTIFMIVIKQVTMTVEISGAKKIARDDQFGAQRRPLEGSMQRKLV